MAFKKTFVLSSEAVNSYGFVVKTAGIRLDNARNNCPAFYDHKTWEVPLGHWENLRVENSKLLGDLIINGDNDREKQYINKIENGDIKGASIGADPITWTEDAAMLTQGQTRPTLSECDLFEASITPLPGNVNALALRHNESLVTLTANNQNDIIPNFKTPDMKAIALKLGLAETATENEILAAIGKVMLKASNADSLQKIAEAAATELASEDDKAMFIELAKSNPEMASKFLASKKPVAAKEATEEDEATTTADAPEKPVTLKKETSIASLIKQGGKKTEAAEDGKDSYDYLQKHNPVELARIHKEDPEKYTKLAKDYGTGVRYTGK
ncbi:MAG TPA: HK97 family phage prohead protease [Panacibacter sp.]|nr:HK97 family phage prohead protease [Panacibacter sp.]HNP46961.1 HK97 family phage prohead protease [Panacibacter sp.]